MYLRRVLLLLLLCIPVCGSAQIMAGWNVASLPGGTISLHAFYHPKNEDWLAFNFGGGYTAKFPFLLDKKEECLKKPVHGGYHFRFGARQYFTMDHTASSVFWGLGAVLSHQYERALLNSCDSLLPDETREQRFKVFSGTFSIGYAWNPVFRKNINHKLHFDFGLQMGFPLLKGGEFMSARNYVSGLGHGSLPIRSLNWEAILMVRWELWHFKYGYRNVKKVKRK